MQSQRVLSQGEIASIIAAAFRYNRLEATDITFDITTGELKTIVTVEEEPLTVREKPDAESGGLNGMDSMSQQMLSNMQERMRNNVGRN